MKNRPQNACFAVNLDVMYGKSMHYFQEHQDRESKVLRDLVRWHSCTFTPVLNLSMNDRLLVEWDKKHYNRIGDVDLVAWLRPGSPDESIIGVEAKVIHLDAEGSFKSKKGNKHHKQIHNLEREGWDLIYFFDIIVVKPEPTWFHSQSFDGYDNYDKEVKSDICGHVVFQINSVSHKPEVDAGSISHRVLKHPLRNPNKGLRNEILAALKQNA